jgi:hypothetical protein
MGLAARVRFVPFTLGIVAACAPDTTAGGHIATPTSPAHTSMPSDSVSGVSVHDGATALRPSSNGGSGSVAASVVRIGHAGANRFVVAYRDGDDSARGGYGIGYAYSDDDGANWVRGAVPNADRVDPHARSAVGVPVLAAGSGADDPPLYLAVAARADDFGGTVILASRSVDGGATFLAPVRAAEPRLDQDFANAESPSLAVDGSGFAHLVFVSDAGTADAVIRHWIGIPGNAACTFSCIQWFTSFDIVRSSNAAIASGLSHPILRFWHQAPYLAFEVRQPLAAPTPDADTAVEIVTARLHPFTSLWVPTTEQPDGGRWIRYRSQTLASAPGGPTDAGAAMDFVLDANGAGRVVWSGIDDDELDAPQRIHVQPFQIVDTLNERWGDPVVISHGDPGAVAFEPAASATQNAASVAWLEQDATTGRVRWMGSVDVGDGSGWSAPRNLTAIGGGDATTLLCPDAHRRWSDRAASVIAPDAHAPGGFMTLTVHASSPGAICGGDRVEMAATRWTAGID